MLPLLETNFFGADMSGILCDEEGQIISSSFDMEGDTYLEDILCLYEITEKDRNKMSTRRF